MGNITSCCETCCQFFPCISCAPRTPMFNRRFPLQSGLTSPSRMNLCYWKTNGRPWQTCCSSSKVRRSHGRLPSVEILTAYLDRTNTNFFSGPPLAALTTLSFSDNVDLQRSAALAFAEITEKEVRPVGRETLDPILFLLSSHDTEVQRAASAALGNLAVNSMYPMVMS